MATSPRDVVGNGLPSANLQRPHLETAELLGQASMYGQPATCRTVARMVAHRFWQYGHAGPSGEHSDGMSSADILKLRLSLPSLGAARILEVLMEDEGASVPFSEIADICSYSGRSVEAFVAQIRSHFRESGHGRALISDGASCISLAPGFTHIIDNWEAIAAANAISKDRHFCECVLRDRLRLARSKEARILWELIGGVEAPLTSSELCHAVPCEPGSLKVMISTLRVSLHSLGLVDCIVTTRPGSSRSKCTYALVPQARRMILELAFGELAEFLLDLPTERVVARNVTQLGFPKRAQRTRMPA